MIEATKAWGVDSEKCGLLAQGAAEKYRNGAVYEMGVEYRVATPEESWRGAVSRVLLRLMGRS